MYRGDRGTDASLDRCCLGVSSGLPREGHDVAEKEVLLPRVPRVLRGARHAQRATGHGGDIEVGGHFHVRESIGVDREQAQAALPDRPTCADLYRAVLRCRRSGDIAAHEHRQPERRRAVPAGPEHAPDDVCKPVPGHDARPAATTGRRSGCSHRSIRARRRVRTGRLVGRTDIPSSRTAAPMTTASGARAGRRTSTTPRSDRGSGRGATCLRTRTTSRTRSRRSTTRPTTAPRAKTLKFLYFGSDRLDTSGDAQQGFQFLQNNACLQPAAGGTPANGNPCPAGVPATSGELLAGVPGQQDERGLLRRPGHGLPGPSQERRPAGHRQLQQRRLDWNFRRLRRGSARTAPVQGAMERLRRPVRRPRRAFVPSPSCSEPVRTALPSRARTTSARRRTRPTSRTSRSGRTPTRTPAIRTNRRPSSRPGST